MARKETLSTKRIVGDAVTKETQRCLTIISNAWEKLAKTEKKPAVDPIMRSAMKDIIRLSPYIMFYPDLFADILKKIE